MKKKYTPIALICIGILLIGLSFHQTFRAMSTISIIGGADWPTFRHFYFGRYSTLAFYGIIAIIAALVIRINNKTLNSIASLSLPLLLFPGLRGSYQWFNKNFLVKWLGCGCPETDELGNIVQRQFNANDFSCIFWFVAALGIGVLSFFMAKRVFLKRKWLIALYVAAIFAWSLFIFRNYCLSMWWC